MSDKTIEIERRWIAYAATREWCELPSPQREDAIAALEELAREESDTILANALWKAVNALDVLPKYLPLSLSHAEASADVAFLVSELKKRGGTSEQPSHSK
jgi:hypothetical protein